MSAIPPLTVTAIPLGWMTIERSTMVIGRHYGQSITVPLWGIAIGGGPKRILVDTGVHDRAWVDAHLGPCKQAPEERLDRALREYVGWSVDDVDIVINTHLHFDHCGGNAMLPNAICYVQAGEWDFAARPLPTMVSANPAGSAAGTQRSSSNSITGRRTGRAKRVRWRRMKSVLVKGEPRERTPVDGRDGRNERWDERVLLWDETQANAIPRRGTCRGKVVRKGKQSSPGRWGAAIF